MFRAIYSENSIGWVLNPSKYYWIRGRHIGLPLTRTSRNQKGILNKEQGISNYEFNTVMNISTFLVRYSLFKTIFCQKKQENQNLGTTNKYPYCRGKPMCVRPWYLVVRRRRMRVYLENNYQQSAFQYGVDSPQSMPYKSNIKRHRLKETWFSYFPPWRICPAPGGIGQMGWLN